MREGKTIIALHGAGMNARVWDMLAYCLGKDTHFSALNLPAHTGAGEEQQPLTSIVDMARWVETHLGHRPAASVVLLGHSMGALAALEAARHPAVAGIVLLGAAAKMPVHADLLKQAQENPFAAGDLVLKWGVNSAHPTADVLRKYLREMMNQPTPACIYADLAACNDYASGEASARQCAKPALVMAGEKDKMARAEEGKALAELILTCRFILLPETGHMAQVEKPAEVAQAVADFVSSF